MSTDMSIEEFCDLHNACDEGRKWALENCGSMAEAWNTARPDWVLWIATRKGVLPDRELRKLSVRFARTVQHLMEDPRSLAALDVADKHTDGRATDDELAAARASASAAAWSSAWAASDSASDAAWAAWAASDAAWAALAAASDAARAERAAAGDAAAGDAAWVSFASMVREHTPNFRKCI